MVAHFSKDKPAPALSRRHMLCGAFLGALSFPVVAQAAQSLDPQPEPIPAPTMTPKERIEYHAECLRAAIEEYGGTRIDVIINPGLAAVVWDEPISMKVEHA